MTSFGFGTPIALLVLLVIPWFWWVQRRTRMDLSERHLQLSAALRAAIVALLALALSQPVIYRSGSSIAVSYLLDVSQSVSPAAVQSAIQWIQQTNDSGRPSSARYIPFGANAKVFDTLDQLTEVRVAETPLDYGIDQTGTNVEAAVNSALQTFARHHLKRLVLITDGNETVGHVTSMLPRLRNEGVHVYTVPLPARMNDDVWVEAIRTPPDVSAEEPFPVEAHVYSQTSTLGEVWLRYGGKELGYRKVQLNRGLNRVAFETSLTNESGPITLEAEVTAGGDSFAGNNKLRSSVLVKGNPRVLYIEGRAQSARYLENALTSEGIAVTTVSPSSIPAAVAELDAFEAIVLSDVPRTSLTEEQMRATAAYVEDLGGGFILAGGENTYGADDGYSKTELERVLPVTFDAKNPRPSVAMIVVLDKSGSMAGSEIGFAREAAKAPLQYLRDMDMFGVVAFDSTFHWAAKLQNASNRDQISKSIAQIGASGETNSFPALEAAYFELAASTSEVKHVILMSDGYTSPANFIGLVTKMTEAKITVSTVALGPSAERDLMANIAKWGQGRTYFARDGSRIPQIFADETELATGNTLHEEPFSLVVKKNVEAFKGIDFATAPRLLGYVAAKSKDTSELLLEANNKDPILVRWQYGLGRTAVFTSDLKDRWAVDWMNWSGYPKFWSQFVRETMRSVDNTEIDLRVVRDADRAKITINAMQKDGQFRNKLESRLRVVTPDQSVSDVAIQQIGPGSYEAEFPLTQTGSHLFRLVGEGGGVSKTLADWYPDEFHFYPPNTDLLRSISSDTEGTYQPRVEDIFNSHGETVAYPTPLWAWLAAMALILYIGDVFLRRVRLFE